MVAAPTAATSAGQRAAVTRRARKYVGKIVSAIAKTPMYLAALYALETGERSHAGDVRIVYSEWKLHGSPRRDVRPVAANERASSASSRSSLKSQGVRCRHASQP